MKMEIRGEPPYRGGRLFFAITEQDYLVYKGNYTAAQYKNLADETGELVYACHQYPSGTIVEEVVYR